MKVTEKSSRVTRGRSGNRQPDSSPAVLGRNTRRSLSASGNEQTPNAKKRKCAAEDKSPVKRNNIAPDPTPLNIQRRKFRDKLGDAFCWMCHKYTDEFYCQDCPRAYHNDCLRKLKSNPNEPLCKCKWTSVDGLKSCTKITSNLPQLLNLSLIKVLEERNNKKLQADAIEFTRLLNTWPEDCEKNDLICDLCDIKVLIDRIHNFKYKNTGEFFQDVKWLYHNSYIAFGPDHEMTTTALKFEKAVKQQLSDMEACGECYGEKCVKFPPSDFFTRVCSQPHLIVWAKLKGFPYWPAKCLRIVNGHADVRFFGTHDKSLIPLTQVYKISRRNPMGNPKKPKNSSRTTNYDESMTELSFYVENYEKQFGSFEYFSEKTLLEPVKKSGKRARQSKNGNQLEVSMNTDVDENDAEASYHFPVHCDTSIGQTLPLLNVSLLHDDPTETKAACRNVLNSSVVLENLQTKNNEDLPQTGIESAGNVVCHMTFDEECHGEQTLDEAVEGTSTSHSQLPEIPVQVTVASVKGSPELCVNVPSSGVLLNNAETSELNSNNYVNINVCDSAAGPSTSDSPLLITSTESLSSIVSSSISEISKINSSESLTSEENIKKTFESLIGGQALPELLPGDDDEIQLVRENHSGNLAGGIFKNQPMLKTFCELLLGNKPNIRNYIASFQNMALHFYLAMWLEANTGKLNQNECKMFHSIYEKLCKAVETLKVQVRVLKSEKEELARKLEHERHAIGGKKALREKIASEVARKNCEDVNYHKKEIIRLLSELDDARKVVSVFEDSKSKTEEELEQFKAKYEDLKEQKLKIEAQKKLQEENIKMKEIEIKTQKEQKEEEIKMKELEIETLKKEKEEQIENLKKLKEEIEFLKKQKELEIEALKKQKEEQINISTKKELEINNLKKQKFELENIKKNYEKELERKEIEFQNLVKNGKEKIELANKSQEQTEIYRREMMILKNEMLKLKDELSNCKCKSIRNNSSDQSLLKIEEETTIETTYEILQSNKCFVPQHMCPSSVFMTPVLFDQAHQIRKSCQGALIHNLEIEEEDEEKKEEEEKEEDKEEEEEEEDREEEEEAEEEEEEDENEEIYEEKDNADEEEEEEEMDVVLESKPTVRSKLRPVRNTVSKRSPANKYSKTRSRATTKVQKAVKLIKKATKPQRKNVSKAVIRKRK